MRPVQQTNLNKQRSRGRGRGKPNTGGSVSSSSLGGSPGGVVNLNRTLDSNGPDVKIRGTVAHILEKYQNLARDANSQGDHVGAENYFQHAEHYLRLLAAANQAQAATRERENSRNIGSRRLNQPENGQETGDQEQGSGYEGGSRENASEAPTDGGYEDNVSSTA
ncbi:MAG: DUF4167 domain-containing protein [Alphaproteobacteria bacterium]